MSTRIVGIDLAIVSAHRASIYDGQSMRFVGKSFLFNRSYEGFTSLLERSANGAPSEGVSFVMEPTSGAWKPLSTFLMAKGYTVYLVKPQKVYDLRKFLKKHTKSDRIDSQTLAKLPIIDPQGIYPLTPPAREIDVVNRYCRQRERIVRSISARKARIQGLFTAVNPLLMECFGHQKFTRGSRAFLRRYSDPYKVVRLGPKRLARFFATHSFGSPPPSLALRIYEASRSAVEIYREAKERSRVPFSPEQFQEEINIELDLMEYEEEKVRYLEEKIEAVYHALDSGGVLQTIPGVGPVIAPSILGATGNPERFRNLRAYKAYCGLVPRKSQSSTRDTKGLPITKSSQRILKKHYCMAAQTARRYDPEAAVLYNRLLARGRHHNQALCAVASNLAGRTFSVMRRAGVGTGSPVRSIEGVCYVLRDFEGEKIDPKRARVLIEERFPSKKKRERVQHLRSRQSLPTSRDNSSKNCGQSLPCHKHTTQGKIVKQESI